MKTFAEQHLVEASVIKWSHSCPCNQKRLLQLQHPLFWLNKLKKKKKRRCLLSYSRPGESPCIERGRPGVS